MMDSNPCLWSAVTVTLGAVAAFIVACGIMARTAYHSGFAAGFNAARERFKRIMNAAGAREIFKTFEDDIDADAP